MENKFTNTGVNDNVLVCWSS